MSCRTARGGIYLAAVALALALTGPAQAQVWDVYKNSQDGTGIPDVNKVPPPPPNQDMSCWLGVASNLLAGAGWGKAGNTAQQNALAIYGHLTNHFTKFQPGFSYLAVNWWLINYGLNSSAPDPEYYNPNGTYTDVSYFFNGAGLTAADYNFLLNELQRCQYVAVSVDTFTDVGHELTLVGGNKTVLQVVPPPAVNTVWHDTDDGLNGDNVILSSFANDGRGTWWVQYPGVQPPGWLAQDWVTLCPGLRKPAKAIENYDVAWYKDILVPGAAPVWGPTILVSGAKAGVYGQPGWDDGNLHFTLKNEERPDPWHKEVWLLVDYLDRDNSQDPGITLSTPTQFNLPATEITFSADNGQILFHWVLDDQPAWETINFPSLDYYNLTRDVKDWNVATLCVPEPASLAALAIGGLLLARRRGRR